MTPAAPALFDRKLLRLRRDRAAAAYAGFDFLRRRASEELLQRLGAVNRTFWTAVDIGAHRGELARALAGRVDLVVSAESSARMLGHAPDPKVLTDEEALPFAAEAFDLAVSALALHRTDDLPGVLVQIRRMLSPDGLFLAALLGGETLRELREAFGEAEADVEGGLSPRVAPFLDVREGGALLQRAGFALPVADLDRVVVRYAGPLALMRDLRGMGETNALTERRRGPLRRATLARALQIYAERFGEPDGRVRATFDIVYLSGWSPHESQQKPLRPGQARTRLSDALKTVERSAGEKPDGSPA